MRHILSTKCIYENIPLMPKTPIKRDTSDYLYCTKLAIWTRNACDCGLNHFNIRTFTHIGVNCKVYPPPQLYLSCCHTFFLRVRPLVCQIGEGCIYLSTIAQPLVGPNTPYDVEGRLLKHAPQNVAFPNRLLQFSLNVSIDANSVDTGAV